MNVDLIFSLESYDENFIAYTRSLVTEFVKI